MFILIPLFMFMFMFMDNGLLGLTLVSKLPLPEIALSVDPEATTRDLGTVVPVAVRDMFVCLF